MQLGQDDNWCLYTICLCRFVYGIWYGNHHMVQMSSHCLVRFMPDACLNSLMSFETSCNSLGLLQTNLPA